MLTKNYSLDFESNELRVINKTFMKFFYSMLDTHSKCKESILLPQSKLLDFINRLKISNEMRVQRYENLSFESIMLLVARDRRRILNRSQRKIPFLGVEPEYAMSLLTDG